MNRAPRRWLAGVSATVVSGILVFWLTKGLHSPAQPNGGPSPPVQPSSSFEPGPASIRISYALGPMEEGIAIVYIEGREAGTLRVGKDRRESSFEITLPRPGRYEYSVQAKMMMRGIVDLESGFESSFRVDSNGRGQLEVEDGKEFLLTTNNVVLGGGGDNTFYAELYDRALLQEP